MRHGARETSKEASDETQAEIIGAWTKAQTGTETNQRDIQESKPTELGDQLYSGLQRRSSLGWLAKGKLVFWGGITQL